MCRSEFDKLFRFRRKGVGIFFFRGKGERLEGIRENLKNSVLMNLQIIPPNRYLEMYVHFHSVRHRHDFAAVTINICNDSLDFIFYF